MQRLIKEIKGTLNPAIKNKPSAEQATNLQNTKKEKKIKVAKGKDKAQEVLGTDYFLIVPQDVLLLIFSLTFKNPYELAKLSTVSKLFLRISSHDALWQQFFDEEAKVSWALEKEATKRALPAKQFLLKEQRRLLTQFSVFASFMQQVGMRSERHLNIVYTLHELFLPPEKGKKGKKINVPSENELVGIYSGVVNILNKFYDLAAGQGVELSNNMLTASCPYIRVFVTFQEMLMNKKTEANIFKYPEILEWVYEFAKKLSISKEQESKLFILLDVIINKAVKDSDKIAKIVTYALEYLNDPQNDQAICAEYSKGGDASEAVLQYALEKVKTEFRPSKS